MAKTKIGGITVEIGADTSDLSKKLKDVNSESKKTTAELKSIDAALKQAPNSVELWKQKQEALSKAVENSKKKLEALVSEQENLKKGLENGTVTEEAYKAYQREIEITKGQIESAEKSLKEFTDTQNKSTKAVEEGAKEAEKSSEGYTVLKNAVANLASEGFEKLMSAAKDAWEEIDAGYDTIITKTGATGKELEALQSVADSVFTSMPVEMNDVGAAVGELNTRFQLTGQELEDLTEYFLQYANINNTAVTSSIKNVSGIMKAFGEDTENTGKVLDALTVIGQKTGKDIGSLESELLSNSATFKELGLDIRQSAELLGQFEAQGIDTSTALAGLKKAQQNAMAEGKSLDTVLTDTVQSIKDAKTETEALQTASDLFGKKGAAAITQAIREQRFSIDDLKAGYEGLGSVVSDTFEATQDAPDKAKIALNNLKLELSRLAEQVLPKIEKLISKGVDNLPKIEKTLKELIPLIKGVGVAYASWKIASTVKGGIDALKTFTTQMKTTELAATSLGKALDTGVLAIISMIAMALVDLGRDIKKAYDEYVPTAERIGKEVSESFNDQYEAIEQVDKSLNDLRESFKDSAQAADIEADKAQDLWTELDKLADASGRVKDSDKKRAEFLLGELSEALGQELTMTGNQIDNYRTLSQEIDKLIEKKRASAYLDAYQAQAGEMGKNKATAYSNYLEAYSQEQAALEEYQKLSMERYGKVIPLEQFRTQMQSTYGNNKVWNLIDEQILKAGETAATAGANKERFQSEYEAAVDYFERLDDAQRAYTEGYYDQVEQRLYYEKEASTETVNNAKTTAEQLEQIYQDQLTKTQAAYELARKTNAKLAQSDMKNLLKMFIQTANAGMQVGGKSSGEIFSDEFKDLVQKMVNEGYDISDLTEWGKESGVQVGDVFGDNYDEVVQKQINEGFDVADLLEWGAKSGELTAAEYVKYFKQNAQRELDYFFSTNANKVNELVGPLTYEDTVNKRNSSSYGPQKLFGAGGYIPLGSEGIVAEAGPELLRVMNGGVQVTNLTPSSKYSSAGAGDKTIINNYYNDVKATVTSSYDVYDLAEDLAEAEKYTQQGRGQ